MIHFIFLLLSLSITFFTNAQLDSNYYTSESAVTTDNDNYLLSFHDGYYTNGFYLDFRKILKENADQKANLLKNIIQIEIGQMIFNPYTYSITEPARMDRPFAGYLYAGVGLMRFYTNEQLLKLSINFGTIGKSSGGEFIQKTYHRLIRIYPVTGWSYQINDEPDLNFNLLAARSISGKLREDQHADATITGNINLGNAFTNAKAGLIFRLGNLESSSQTVYWGSRLNLHQTHYRNKAEFFFFFNPQVMYQIYNATIQGGLFIKNKGPVTSDINAFVYLHRFGFNFAKDRISVVLAIEYITKEAVTMRTDERYGVIGLSYRFNKTRMDKK